MKKTRAHGRATYLTTASTQWHRQIQPSFCRHRQQELSPTARRRPSCCSQRCCPTPFQTSARQQHRQSVYRAVAINAAHFRELLRAFEDPVIASSQAVRQRRAKKQRAEARHLRVSSRPVDEKLSPTARRHPFYYSRRSSPTLNQPRSTGCC